MPDLSDTVAKCRIGTAKIFTLLLLLYHTQTKFQELKYNEPEKWKNINGQRQVFYGNEGVVVITKFSDKRIYKIAWMDKDFDEATNTIMEMINKYGK